MKSVFGLQSSGLALNLGEAGYLLGNTSSGLVITLTEIREYGDQLEGGKLLKPQDCDSIPELKDYLERLKLASQSIKDSDSVRDFISQYGKTGKKIKRDVKRILKASGIEIDKM